MRTSDLLQQRDDTQDRSGATDLFDGRSDDYRERWTDIQTRFVDEPQHAVEQADGLVAEVITAPGLIRDRFAQPATRTILPSLAPAAKRSNAASASAIG